MRSLSPFVVRLLSISVIAGATHAQTGGPPPSANPIPPDQLDKLLAPIALYPDALIIQIVQCAASPYEVTQVSDWLSQNPDLKGTAAQDAAKQKGFDADFVAIVLFPDVVHMMADKADWTRQLGQAFTSDRDGVFASIQRLRSEAEAAGNLKTNQQQDVKTVSTDSGQQVIVIQPANPQVVYVPQYNPQVVYTQPAASTSTAQSGSGAGAAAVVGFAAGVIIGAAADDHNDSYYYGYGGWGYHGAALSADGWNNYYQHRENMTNDYYDHRENMAGQRGENQSNRQDRRSDNVDTRQSARTDNQSTRQATASEARGSGQFDRGTAARGGSAEGRSETRTGMNSGAFSGYQRGSTERQSSARGHRSMGGRFGGGGHFGGGGGRFGGGGRRGRR